MIRDSTSEAARERKTHALREREITFDDFQLAVTSTSNSPFVCIISRLSTEPTLLLKGSRPTGQFRVSSTTSSNHCDAGGSRPIGQFRVSSTTSLNHCDAGASRPIGQFRVTSLDSCTLVLTL